MPTAAAMTRITTMPIDALLEIADLVIEVDIFILKMKCPSEFI